MKQSELNPTLQKLVLTAAGKQYPALVTDFEVPLVVALPRGIHPYNRNSGYYDGAANAIVMYQDEGKMALHLAHGRTSDPSILHGILNLIHHELAHWYQINHLGEKSATSTNIHRRRSWSTACYHATCNLWPDLKLEEWQFRPYTTKRIKGQKNPVRVQREGALTDTELHHWPDCLFSANGTGAMVNKSQGYVTDHDA